MNTPNVVTNLASCGYIASLRFLLEMGADVNSCLPYVGTAVICSVMTGKMVRYSFTLELKLT